MGVEPTWDACAPYTDFEDQGHHRAPVTSANIIIFLGYVFGTFRVVLFCHGTFIIILTRKRAVF